MGAGDRVVGVSNYDRFPPEVDRLPRVGGLLDPNVERVLSLKPDLVIVYDTQTELKQQLERAGIPIFGYAHRGLRGHHRDDAGARRAHRRQAPPRTPPRRRIEQQLAAIRPRASRAGRGRRRCWSSAASRARCATSTRAAATASCTTCSSSPAAPTCSRDLKQQSVDMSTEMILTRAPEVIIELHYGESLRPERLDAGAARLERAAVGAGRAERIASTCSSATSSSSRARASCSPRSGSRGALHRDAR